MTQLPDQSLSARDSSFEGTESNAVNAPSAEGTSVQPPESADHSLWLSGSDRFFLVLVSSIVLGLMGAHWLRLSGFGRRPVEIDQLPPRAYEFRIDINTADWIELSQLEGVGETLAQRIVADKEKHGNFQSIEELDRVEGIGPKTIDELRPWIAVSRNSGDMTSLNVKTDTNAD